MSIRVVVDARSLSDSSAFRGIGTYVRCLLAGLGGVDELTAIAMATGSAQLPAGIERQTINRRAPGRLANLEHRALLPLELLRVPADVVHSPALDPPRFSRAPIIETLHDVVPAPDSDIDLGCSRRWRRAAKSLRRATAVVAVSRAAADSAAARLGVDPAKLHVIHHGVGERFHRRRCVPSDPPYLLYVSQFTPSKGYPDAFELIASLAELGYPHRLKVAGRIWPWVRPEVDAILDAARRPDRIDLLGYVDPLSGLAELYVGASAYISTSRHESFGLPVVEAMAVGVPTVAYANSSAPEIIGEGGMLVADGDIGELVKVVRGLLDDRARWADRSAQAKRWASRYTWDRSVAAHVEVYRSAAGR